MSNVRIGDPFPGYDKRYCCGDPTPHCHCGGDKGHNILPGCPGYSAYDAARWEHARMKEKPKGFWARFWHAIRPQSGFSADGCA